MPFINFFTENKILRKINEEIMDKNYSYFSFDLERIFTEKRYMSIALCLINFHIWHKEFID